MVENSRGEKFLPTSSTSIILQASKMCFIPYRGTKLHMARNIFCIHKVVIKVILRNFLVEAMKITPFNGSIFLKTQSNFYRYHLQVCRYLRVTNLIILRTVRLHVVEVLENSENAVLKFPKIHTNIWKAGRCQPCQQRWYTCILGFQKFVRISRIPTMPRLQNLSASELNLRSPNRWTRCKVSLQSDPLFNIPLTENAFLDSK
jgi:hypothetical protein